MLRGYRGIVAALGLVLAANHPSTVAQPKLPSAQDRSVQALENIASRYNDQAERANSSRETEPCQQGEAKRYSELCAQWKAADAAQLSAWLNLASIAAVLVALFLAFQSNRISRDTAKRQLRAYVGLHKSPITELKAGEFPKVELNFLNAGQTPAREVRVAAALGVDHFPRPDSDDKLAGLKRSSVTYVLPGSDFKLRLPSAKWPDLNQETVDAIKDGKAAVYCFGVVEYFDIFGKAQKTEFSLMMGGDVGGYPNKLMITSKGNTMT